MDSIYLKKKYIRKEILSIRNNMNQQEKQKSDTLIKESFLESDYYKNSKNIFIYISYSSEIDTKDIINTALNEGKSVFVPRTVFQTKVMDAVRIKSLDNLKKDKYGILEPSEDEPYLNPDDLDLIVVPGVAFDREGGRTGYGAGYYDRYFKKLNKKISKVALAYDFQIINNVPMNNEDVRVDCIITEKEIIK